jgi:hypothetical protein
MILQTELVDANITESKLVDANITTDFSPLPIEDTAESNGDDLGCQDIFDSLTLSTDRRESFYFQHDRESPLSRSFRTRTPSFISSEEQGAEENTVSQLCLQRVRPAVAHDRPPSPPMHSAHSSSTGMQDWTASSVASNRRATTEGFADVDARPPVCRLPIDLTKLLNRCEGDVELLAEVSVIRCHHVQSSASALSLRSSPCRCSSISALSAGVRAWCYGVRRRTAVPTRFTSTRCGVTQHSPSLASQSPPPSPPWDRDGTTR